MADDDMCDIDALADLLEEDGGEEAQTKPQPSTSTSDSDLLKKKLEEMEKQMEALKQQLKQQNITSSKQTIKDVGLDFSASVSNESIRAKAMQVKQEMSSEVHQDNGESSEDEANPNAEKYNEFGKFVKKRLAHQPVPDRLKGKNIPQGWKSKTGALTTLGTSSIKKDPEDTGNGFTDPFFGIKIMNPLVSSTTLMQKMEGRKQIKLSQIKLHMRGGDIKEDWVTMAVVISKSEPRTSQKGKKYSVWKLSDLKDCTKLVSFFLFGEVFTTHWKMAVGSIVGILNPNFMKDSNSDEVTFTVDNHQKVLHVGSSRDLGWCKATRKDGSKCPSFVNKSECEFCVYHVQQEFKKTSAKRSEIQSNFSGTGLSTKDRLKQKVLGKQEVFYGGQLFSGKVVAPPSNKTKDNKILSSLKLQDAAKRLKEEEEEARKALSIKTEFSERLLNPTAGSRNLLACMEPKKGAPDRKGPINVAAPMKSISAKDLLEQHKQKMLSMRSTQLQASTGSPSMSATTSSPQLGRGMQSQSEIDLSEEIRLTPTHPRMETAKLKALRMVQMKGPLKPSDPNSPIQKPTTPDLQAKVRKRVFDSSSDGTKESAMEQEQEERPKKRSKAELDALLEAKSSHANLIDEYEEQQSDAYFSKLERKEQLENKMLSTFEVKTTAVTCPKCNYTALSASDLCRKEGHPIRTIKAVKRFFQCKDCKNRTISLDRLPKRPCTQCGSSSWERAAMWKERKGPVLPHEELLLRGEERKHLNN